MSFDKSGFTRVVLPTPPSKNEVTFNRDGKITLSKDLSREVSLLEVWYCNDDVDVNDIGANIFAKKAMVDTKKKDAAGKMQTSKKEQVVELYIEFVPFVEGVDCKCNYLSSQGKLRINAKTHLQVVGVKSNGQKYGSSAITVIQSSITDKDGDFGVVIDLTKRPLPKKKKKATKPSAPAGEQAAPKTKQKSTKIVESATGALQMK